MPTRDSPQSRLIAQFLPVVSGFGIDPAEMFAAVGLSADRPRAGHPIPAGTFCDMVEWLARRSGRADFGLKAGELAGATIMGPLALLIEHCGSIEELYHVLRCYLPLYNSGTRYSLTPFGDSTLLRLHVDTSGESAPHHYAELALTICISGCRLILGPEWAPERVYFTHARLARDADYARVFRAPVSFAAPVQGLLISTAEMHRRIDGANSHLKLMLEAYFQDFRQAQTRDKAARVAELIGALLPTGDVSLPRVAEILAQHPQTLQRRLRAQGTGYGRILADVRLDLAQEYLANPDLPATEIAALLGFSEASALSRFMRQHAGVSPRAVRAEQKT